MRRVFLLCAMTVSISLAFSQSPTPKSYSPFEQELVDNQKQFMQAFQEKNVAYVNQAVGDDFRGIATNGDLYDKTELAGDAQDGMPKDFRIYDLQVVRVGDACAVVAYNLIVPGGRPRYRHMSDTWSKDGGRWKLKFRQVTPNLWSALDLD